MQIRAARLSRGTNTMFTLRALIALPFLLLAGLVAAGEFDAAKAVVKLKKEERIIFFGDSLTALAGQIVFIQIRVNDANRGFA
jgi:hypothetical protein